MSTSITIRNVPTAVRDELAARAARSGRSLQEYVLAELTELADRATTNDVLAEIRARKRATGTRVDAAEIIEAVTADRR